MNPNISMTKEKILFKLDNVGRYGELSIKQKEMIYCAVVEDAPKILDKLIDIKVKEFQIKKFQETLE